MDSSLLMNVPVYNTLTRDPEKWVFLNYINTSQNSFLLVFARNNLKANMQW